MKLRRHPNASSLTRTSVYPRPAVSKYRNKRCVVNGIEFHSLAEARRYAELLNLLEGGSISNLELQPCFPMIVDGIVIATYKADFAYFIDGKRVIEDVKGFKTPTYRLKKRHVEAQYKVKIVEISARKGTPPAHIRRWFSDPVQPRTDSRSEAG